MGVDEYKNKLKDAFIKVDPANVIVNTIKTFSGNEIKEEISYNFDEDYLKEQGINIKRFNSLWNSEKPSNPMTLAEAKVFQKYIKMKTGKDISLDDLIE